MSPKVYRRRNPKNGKRQYIVWAGVAYDVNEESGELIYYADRVKARDRKNEFRSFILTMRQSFIDQVIDYTNEALLGVSNTKYGRKPIFSV